MQKPKLLSMKKQQLQKILEDITTVKIAVVGDFCLDVYWFIDESMSEMSVETGLSTRPVRQQRYSLGGAGNVANNLAAMGINDVCVFGVIGTDPFGAEMLRIMKATGIQTGNLLIQEELWHTHTYAKPYADDKEMNRIDFGNYNQLSEKTADLLINNLINEIPGVDIILINQQVPSGIHTEYFRKQLLEVIRKFPGKLFIADSRQFVDYFTGTIRKMNDHEAVRLCGLDKKPDEIVLHQEVVDASKTLYERFRKPLFITRGDKGSLTVDSSGIFEVPGLLILSRVDTVGAGDSYLAGAAAALAAGYGMDIAAAIGTFVAGVTVQKLFQTGTATPEEILSLGQDPDYVYLPELAEDIRQAKNLPDTEIEVVNPWKEKLQIRHAIFDHDGTISTLREGWEKIMSPMMIRAVLGDKYMEADEALYGKVHTRIQDFIDMTTGIQTLAQMKYLLDLIVEFGCVPREKMLDEAGYKQIYNQALLKMVGERAKKYDQGELSLEDLTIKNAVSFLRKLHNAGIQLYLASGTDIEDVKKEAHALGYDHLFEGRIFGSVGDISVEAKKLVLNRIMNTIGESAFGSVATFGDGPVEIRETRKRGGITIGVASNEIKRFGLNEHKRSRLIKAGADIIIPDFSQSQQLLRLLNI
jgi:rfaE bifunctional protein kinase chain/domain